MPSLTLAPVADAVSWLQAKRPIASVLRTAEWARIPIDLRNRAQFSAGVESARLLQRIQDGVLGILDHRPNQLGGLEDRSGFIRDLITLAESEGIRPAKRRGGLTDIGSERRAELIYQQQVGQAYGYAHYKGAQDPDALQAAPAQELVRVRQAKIPRDWIDRWQRAGGRLIQGRMIALKSDDIWRRISRFDNPWPPYDFGSGMWVEDILAPEAIDLGLIAPGQRIPPSEPDFNRHLEASVTNLSPELRQNLQSLFGPQVDVDANKIQWKGTAHDYAAAAPDLRQTARSVFARSQEAFRAMGLGDLRAEIPRGVQEAVGYLSRTNSVEISAVASGRKPLYHEDLSWYRHEALDRYARSIQRRLPQGVVARHAAGHLYVYHPDLVGRLADPSQPLWPQIVAHRDNGLWLGYGLQRGQGRSASILILASDGTPVTGFQAPAATAELYGAARARDWTDATGEPHLYRIVP